MTDEIDAVRIDGPVRREDVVEEATEDAYRAAAVDPLTAGYLETRWYTLAWKRGIWLTILFFGALLTAQALGQYEAVLAGIPWLVVFIPLVVSSGGNTGNQSATLIITALSRGDVRPADWLRVVWHELAVGMVLVLGGGLYAARRRAA